MSCKVQRQASCFLHVWVVEAVIVTGIEIRGHLRRKFQCHPPAHSDDSVTTWSLQSGRGRVEAAVGGALGLSCLDLDGSRHVSRPQKQSGLPTGQAKSDMYLQAIFFMLSSDGGCWGGFNIHRSLVSPCVGPRLGSLERTLHAGLKKYCVTVCRERGAVRIKPSFCVEVCDQVTRYFYVRFLTEWTFLYTG